MQVLLWIFVGLVVIVAVAGLAFVIYFRRFGKKVVKTNQRILELLDNGLLEQFRNQAPYEEVQEEYGELIDLLDMFGQYVHFISLREEKEFERQNDYLTLQYVQVDGEKVARFHFRAFPIKSLPEKFRPKEMLTDSFRRAEELLYEDGDLAYIELITHNRLLNETVLKRIIQRGNLNLRYVYDDQFETGYLPWIYSEWLMIHGGENPKSEEVYQQLRKLNQPINIKLYRQSSEFAPRG